MKHTRTAEKTTHARTNTARTRYLVAGPGNREWSVWDFGDEMTAHDGPLLTDSVVARIPEHVCRRLEDADRKFHAESACAAIHVAKLLDSESPNFRHLWRLP